MRRRQTVKSAESITTRTGVRRIGAVVAIALAASAAGGATAQAGTDSWTPLAQPPQMVPSVTSISFGPGGVGYASGGERAFRTTDGGATWTVRSQSLGALTADPFDPQRVYAWRTHWPRERNGNPQLTRIGISTNGGTSFTEIDPHLPFTVEGDLEGRVDILPDPVHPGLLYMSIQQSSSCAFLRSSDHAATWTVLTTPWRTCRLAVDQAGQLYTGADGHGVMRSTDRGATWTSGSTGIPRKPNGDQPVGVTVVSAAHAGVAYTSAAKAIYRTTDSGAHWSATGVTFGRYFQLLAVDRWHDDVLWARNGSTHLIRSTNAGATWTALGAVHADTFGLHPLAFDTSQTDHVLAAPQIFFPFTGTGPVGILGSADDGAGWSPSQHGLLAPVPLGSVALSPDHPGVMYASGQTGHFVSHDSGATWSGSPAQGPFFTRFNRIKVIPGTPDTVFAYGEEGYRSADGGQTWQPVSIPGSPSLDDLTVGGGGGIFTVTQPGGVWSSHDKGDTWTRITAPRFMSSISAGAGSALYATNGDLWKQTSTGWTKLLGSAFCRWVVADPVHQGVVYAAVNTAPRPQLLRSTDGGAHWTDVAPEQAWGGSLIEPRLMLDPNNSNRLFLDGGVKDRRQLLISNDLGAHWSAAPNDTTNLSRQFLDLAPGSPTRLIDIMRYRSDPHSGPLDDTIEVYTP